MVTVNGASNMEGGGCGRWGRHVKLRQLKARRMQLKREKKYKKNQIAVLKVNNANWHFASRQAEEKRLKKRLEKKPWRKMFCCKTTTAASPAGRQSEMTVAVISQFSSFRISVFGFGFWIFRRGWKSESIKVTKWLNFGVRQSALNVHCLPVACCTLPIDCWLLGRLWPIGRKSEKSRNTWGQGVASTAVASCCHTMWQRLYVSVYVWVHCESMIALKSVRM